MDLSTTILDATIEFTHQPFLKPLQLSSGLIESITEARATVRVSVAGHEATGRGSIYLSDLWAWPEPSLTHDQRDAVLRGVCETIAAQLPTLCGDAPAHPLELGLHLHHSVCETALFAQEPAIPALALAMCASPFDAALHDAVGQALQCSAFVFYDEPCTLPCADPYFADGNAARAIREVIQQPQEQLAAWLIVGAADKLPDAIRPWIEERGYHCFKIKLLAKDTAIDVARTVEIYRSARQCGLERVRLSVDSNEGNPDATSVLDYLTQLQATDAEAYAALEYLEQPTGRDITKHPYDWTEVNRHKPVLLDEGLTSLDLLDEARRQHWGGFALKTCKGHSFALVAAAWAHENGLLLTVQDLTNPGLAAIHSALFAAHLPSRNGIELNSPQYTPAANADWLPRLAPLLEPRDGQHTLTGVNAIGLGSTS
jgi:L-alanine-DL-glutamate epimerase-like enolase superfamily enzyme